MSFEFRVWSVGHSKTQTLKHSPKAAKFGMLGMFGNVGNAFKNSNTQKLKHSPKAAKCGAAGAKS